MTGRYNYPVIISAKRTGRLLDRVRINAPHKKAAKELFEYYYSGFKISVYIDDERMYEVMFGKNANHALERLEEQEDGSIKMPNVNKLDFEYIVDVEGPESAAMHGHRPAAFDLLGYTKSRLPEDVEWDEIPHKIQQQVKIANKTMLQYLDEKSMQHQEILAELERRSQEKHGDLEDTNDNKDAVTTESLDRPVDRID